MWLLQLLLPLLLRLKTQQAKKEAEEQTQPRQSSTAARCPPLSLLRLLLLHPESAYTPGGPSIEVSEGEGQASASRMYKEAAAATVLLPAALRSDRP